MGQTKKLTFFLLSMFFLFSCSPANSLRNTNNQVRDGSSFEKAIIVKSISAEYKWLSEQYPNCQTQIQMLSNYKNKYYDILSIICEDGSEKDVYFDISKFFGKF